ncbi:putative membrane protein [Campylobacter pinnipediorum subsp. caledonicus]|uniref:hypothetical protein n=1 Tax=Campylobacter pinnipediorum TaxID=1965231 RepID=UPI00099552FB|nr:hypothetical protein [Campylobacter pinnipediorum]AQW86286.1 putative membrane protein [Campylobacter pinnipediorum subsp. caledonicus]
MIEHLQELHSAIYPFHKGMMHLLLTLVVIHLALTQIGINTKNYVLRIRYFLPLYHLAFAVVFFTGVLMLVALNFNLTWHIARMIISFIGLVTLNIIGYKKLKKYAPLNELGKFRKFAFFQILGEIFFVLFAGL